MIKQICRKIRGLLSTLGILPVLIYQVGIGPLLPKVCIYYPSCSEYFILAVKKYGPLSGSCRGLLRICRCTPWHRGGYDPP